MHSYRLHYPSLPPHCLPCPAPPLPCPALPGVLTDTTAELALALTFAAARRVVEADYFMRAGKYKGWLPSLFVGQLLQVRPPAATVRPPAKIT